MVLSLLQFAACHCKEHFVKLLQAIRRELPPFYLLFPEISMSFASIALYFDDIYCERLIRAYLGASNSNRNENPFTRFDENDNIKMCDLWVQEKFDGKLMPVVNIAPNLVSGEKLGWHRCGKFGWILGFRSTSIR